MSNVIIGLIGVILFIGLAIAGAFYLGPRFTDANGSSRAAAVVGSLSQVVNASNLYRMREGTHVRVGYLSDLTANGYLKTTPLRTFVRDSNGSNVTGAPTAMIFITSRVDLPLADDRICREFNRQVGANDGTSTPSSAVVPPTIRSGCFVNTAVIGQELVGTYIYFQRV